MTLELRLLVYTTLLTWLMIIVASALKARMWTWRGIWVGLGNRDDVPEPLPVAARADRAAKNMLENLVMFAALVLVAHLAEADHEKVVTGARVFFWARVVYFPLYLAGVRVVRTIAWLISLAGLWMIIAATLGAH